MWWWFQFQVFFIVTPKIGEDEPILTNIFQMGWNQQLVTNYPNFMSPHAQMWRSEIKGALQPEKMSS